MHTDAPSDLNLGFTIEFTSLTCHYIDHLQVQANTSAEAINCVWSLLWSVNGMSTAAHHPQHCLKASEGDRVFISETLLNYGVRFPPLYVVLSATTAVVVAGRCCDLTANHLLPLQSIFWVFSQMESYVIAGAWKFWLFEVSSRLFFPKYIFIYFCCSLHRWLNISI